MDTMAAATDGAPSVAAQITLLGFCVPTRRLCAERWTSWPRLEITAVGSRAVRPPFRNMTSGRRSET